MPQGFKDFFNRILPQEQGKRELLFVVMLFVVIAGAGYIGGQTGFLYKDVPTSATPTAEVTTPPATTVTTPVSNPSGD